MKWISNSSPPTILCCWGDEFVVFNSLSGDTHLLGSFAGKILLKLQEASLDASSLNEFFAPTQQVDPEHSLEFQIEHILAELDSLALIERI